MKCPTCRNEFHPQPDSSEAYFSNDTEDDEGFAISVQLCPSCSNVVVSMDLGEATELHTGIELSEITSRTVIYPKLAATALPVEVPTEYADDYEEAVEALEYSPKASAALSRRLLQKSFHLILGIKKKDLSLKIDEFIAKSDAPQTLKDQVDAIRQIGNFASHPIKSQHSGEIVEVETGEAEWLIEVLEQLFDFIFVKPAKQAQRIEGLNKKLRDVGKPPLKVDAKK